MSGHFVNYDEVAPTYNQRFTNQKDRPIAAALIKLIRESGAEMVLEAGCGTGRWLADLLADQATSPNRLFGLDRSAGMLAQVQNQQPNPQIVQGLAEWLPFPAGSFDLIYCVNALHHFSRPYQFVHQAFRLLRPGGHLAVTGMDPRYFLAEPGQPAKAHWYIYEFFEGTLETDLIRFPSWGQILDWMTIAGFEHARLQPVERIRDSKIGAAIWSDPFLQKHSTSQLILLTDEEYQNGLNLIQTTLQKAETAKRTVTFPIDLLIDMLVGWKPEK